MWIWPLLHCTSRAVQLAMCAASTWVWLQQKWMGKLLLVLLAAVAEGPVVQQAVDRRVVVAGGTKDQQLAWQWGDTGGPGVAERDVVLHEHKCFDEAFSAC